MTHQFKFNALRLVFEINLFPGKFIWLSKIKNYPLGNYRFNAVYQYLQFCPQRLQRQVVLGQQ